MEPAREVSRELGVGLEMGRQRRERGLGVSPAASLMAHGGLGVKPEAGSERVMGTRSRVSSVASGYGMEWESSRWRPRVETRWCWIAKQDRRFEGGPGPGWNDRNYDG